MHVRTMVTVHERSMVIVHEVALTQRMQSSCGLTFGRNVRGKSKVVCASATINQWVAKRKVIGPHN